MTKKLATTPARSTFAPSFPVLGTVSTEMIYVRPSTATTSARQLCVKLSFDGESTRLTISDDGPTDDGHCDAFTAGAVRVLHVHALDGAQLDRATLHAFANPHAATMPEIFALIDWSLARLAILRRALRVACR